MVSAAVAGMGLQEAADQATDAIAAAGSHSGARLHALADSYIAFIRNRPYVHDLAYGPLVAKADHPRLQQAAIAYWDLLHDAVEACQPPGTSEADVLRGCADTWGTVYGIARLAALHQIPRCVPSEFDRLIHQALDTLRLGWAQQTRETDGVATEPQLTEDPPAVTPDAIAATLTIEPCPRAASRASVGPAEGMAPGSTH